MQVFSIVVRKGVALRLVPGSDKQPALAVEAEGTHVPAHLLAFHKPHLVAATEVDTAVEPGKGGFVGKGGEAGKSTGFKARPPTPGECRR